MGYYTVLPGNKPEDNDMLLYVENDEGIIVRFYKFCFIHFLDVN
jgi:hypothetical protein